MTADDKRPTYEAWMGEVERELQRLVGRPDFGTKDIGDFFYRDRYDEGYDPRAVALEALKEDDMWAMQFEDWGDDDDRSSEAQDDDVADVPDEAGRPLRYFVGVYDSATRQVLYLREFEDGDAGEADLARQLKCFTAPSQEVLLYMASSFAELQIAYPQYREARCEWEEDAER